jgi:hypothetical protein
LTIINLKKMVFIRVHLLESLRLSETVAPKQLRLLSLTMLGSMFLDTDVVQAEKMLSAAFKISSKGGPASLAHVCANILAELHRRRGDQNMAAKLGILLIASQPPQLFIRRIFFSCRQQMPMH